MLFELLSTERKPLLDKMLFSSEKVVSDVIRLYKLSKEHISSIKGEDTEEIKNEIKRILDEYEIKKDDDYIKKLYENVKTNKNENKNETDEYVNNTLKKDIGIIEGDNNSHGGGIQKEGFNKLREALKEIMFYLQEKVNTKKDCINEIKRILDFKNFDKNETIDKKITEKCINQSGGEITEEQASDAPGNPGQGEAEPGKNINDLRNYYDQLKNSKYLKEIEIENQDIALFVVSIFVIRIISLILLRLVIDIEFIQTFEHSLIFFVGIYIILFGILYFLVNIEYNNKNILPNYLYYYYSKTNGYYRIIIHIILLLVILIIPLIIKAEQDDVKDQYVENNDLSNKRRLYNDISNFSLILWVFSTIIALIIK